MFEFFICTFTMIALIYSVFSALFTFYKKNEENKELQNQKIAHYNKIIDEMSEKISQLTSKIGIQDQKNKEIGDKILNKYQENIKIITNIFKILERHEKAIRSNRILGKENKTIWH